MVEIKRQVAFDVDFGLKVFTKQRKNLPAVNRLRPIMKQWAQNIERYCRDIKDKDGSDAPYYYNERANLSLLAAAAWQSGVIALEEYPAVKISKRAKSQRCRTDLFFALGGEDGLQVEAKLRWMRASMGDATAARRIRKGIDAALRAAERNTESDARIACTFFVPLFPKTDFPDFESRATGYIREELDRFVEKNGREADVWAWCFPRSGRKVRAEEREGSNYYPGLLIALKFGKNFHWGN